MKYAPNMFLHYVSDIARARTFYESILEMETILELPEHIAWHIGNGFVFAIQYDPESNLTGNVRRTGELAVAVNLSDAEVNTLYAEWIANGAREVEPPHNEPWGYTFLVADPDGNQVRFAPANE